MMPLKDTEHALFSSVSMDCNHTESHTSSSVIVRVSVVLKRTVGDSD